jgi:hypothetical protein
VRGSALQDTIRRRLYHPKAEHSERHPANSLSGRGRKTIRKRRGNLRARPSDRSMKLSVGDEATAPAGHVESGLRDATQNVL